LPAGRRFRRITQKGPDIMQRKLFLSFFSTPLELSQNYYTFYTSTIETNRKKVSQKR